MFFGKSPKPKQMKEILAEVEQERRTIRLKEGQRLLKEAYDTFEAKRLDKPIISIGRYDHRYHTGIVDSFDIEDIIETIKSITIVDVVTTPHSLYINSMPAMIDDYRKRESKMPKLTIEPQDVYNIVYQIRNIRL